MSIDNKLACDGEGQFKKRFQGEDNVCYESLSSERIRRDFKIEQCPYMEGYLEKEVDGRLIFYSRCKYKENKKN